jgi:hypothetical protein
VRESIWPAFINLSTAGLYPDALFTPASIWLVAVAMVLLLSLVRAPAPAVLIPLLLVVVFHLAGRPVYFPMRFESVIAGPLLLWIAGTKFRWQHAALAAIGAFVLTIGIRDHLRRPLDPYREAALLLLRNASPDESIVATGYPYLETVAALRRPVIAFPRDQAKHPGWRSTVPADPRELPAQPFLWIGERAAPELATIRGVRTVQPLFTNERAIVARVTPLTPRLH